MKSKRVLRVDNLIKRELNQLFLRELDVSFGVFITITRVETTSNLIEANVFVSIFPEEKKIKTLEFLSRKVYFLQQKLNRRLKMRPVPRIKFLEEKKIVEANQIEEILERLKK